ncbi:MAG: antibiotic biosynthesis monooxygenase [Coriobacteriia bacterium]|nr:antibiotic biosynthesis monooxygenase [Coriobacteriia bacterium]
MIKVHAAMELKPEAIDSLRPLVAELVSATVQEKGCHNYNFCEQNDKPGAFAIIETWEDQASLDEHMQSEHFTRLIPEISAFVTGEIVITVFNVLI